MTYGVIVMVGASVALAAGLISLRLPGPIAQPVPDRWHKKSTPVTGGVALLLGLLLALAAGAAAGDAPPSVAYIAVGATAAFTIGFLDDKRSIGPRAKFVGQIAVAAGTAAAIHPHWLPIAAAIPLGTFVLVAAMNSFNFLDNIDGLAAGVAGIAAGALALTTLFAGGLAPRLLGCAAAGACLGFLPLNYRPHRPASFFMGDSGSHLLGLVVAASALVATPGGAGGVAATVLAPLLILALPIIDTSLVIIVRLAEGRPIWQGGRDHISHRLVYIGLSEREAVGVLLALAAACAGVAIVISAANNALVTGAAVGLVFALLIGLSSRLALVTGNGVEMGDLAAVDSSAPVADAPIAREAELSEDLQSAVVELAGEPAPGVVQDHARAN
jgi:UDP-GlcNAc:undecaprenyl-phosphate/decaprenyl-phosphate GlcNAc-1-phosphate transferase